MTINERTLTPKLRKIVELSAQGMTDKEIAAEMGVTPNTVESHWKRLRVIFRTSSRTHIVATALTTQMASLREELALAQARIANMDRLLLTGSNLAGQQSAKAASTEFAGHQVEAVLAEFPVVIYLTKPGQESAILSSSIESYGYEAQSFANGSKSMDEFIHQEDLCTLRAIGAFPRREEQGEVQMQYRIVDGDGQESWVLDRSKSVSKSRSGDKWIVGHICDISHLVGSGMWQHKGAMAWHNGRVLAAV